MNRLNKLKYFCFFLGYPQSGRTIIGNILDAHPNATLCNNYEAVEALVQKKGDRNTLIVTLLGYSLKKAKHEKQSFVKLDRNYYPYNIEGQLKTNNEIQVLGDCGISFIRLSMNESIECISEKLASLQATLGTPIKFLHVIRNPFDMTAKEESLVNLFSGLAPSINKISSLLGKAVMDVYYEDFVGNPKVELKKICAFLELEAGDDYLERVAGYVCHEPRQRRFEVKWSENLKKEVQKIIDLYPCYQRYSFNGEKYKNISCRQSKINPSGKPGSDNKLLVSARAIGPDRNILTALHNRYYDFVGVIHAVYSFVWGEFSLLYGGRGYNRYTSITPEQISLLQKQGINLYLPLSNHFFSLDDYKQSKPLLKKYHIDGNGVICVSDELAMAIKNDFPKYIVKASMIKNIRTHQEIEDALKIYDQITLRMELNDREDFLQEINQKDKVYLFANSKCEYHCEMNCLSPFSKRLKEYQHARLQCWRQMKALPVAQYMEFDLNDPQFAGFHLFKVEPEYVSSNAQPR